MEGARVAIQGLGNVGQALARFLADCGCRIVALSDSGAAVHSTRGIDLRAAIAYKMRHGSLAGLAETEPIGHADLVGLDCEILAPCALANELTAANAAQVRARLIVEGANGPTTPAADRILAEHGVTVVPDILANAGGVTVSSFEWVQGLQVFFWDEAEINQRLERVLPRAYDGVAEAARRYVVDLRTAAQCVAVDPVRRAPQLRGVFP